MGEYINILIQTLGAFTAILIFTRILGKQQIAQLTFYEYINGITFGSIAATMATDIGQKTFHHFIGLTVFALLTLSLSYISLWSRPARKVLEGEATVVIQNGKILEDNLKKAHHNLDDLLSQLRQKNVFELRDLEFAILEPNGELSVLLKTQKQPITNEKLSIPTEYQGVPSELIMDGKVIHQNLDQNNLSEAWLIEELRKKGSNLSEVFFAALLSDGSIYVDLHKDSVKSELIIKD